jgi:sortase A
VASSLVVGPDDTWIANQTAEKVATLYACHPPGSAAERYVVQMKFTSAGPDA